MNEDRVAGSALQNGVLRGQAMKTPDDVSAMLRLKALGWGAKRIARELGCSHHTVKGYVAAGGATPFTTAKSGVPSLGEDSNMCRRAAEAK